MKLSKKILTLVFAVAAMCAMMLTAFAAEGTLAVPAEMLEIRTEKGGNNVLIFAAFYEESGKMDSVKSVPANATTVSVTAKQATLENRFFCLDSVTYHPLATQSAGEVAIDKFELVFPNTDQYLYRVGNANNVALGSLFKALDGVTVGNVSVTVTKLDADTNVAGTYTANASNWTQSTLRFSGSGPVLVTISDDSGAVPVTLALEVVAGYNVTTYSGGSYPLSNRNSVLLNDITMTSGGTYSLTSNRTLYGNGFTFDVTRAANTITAIYMDSSTIDNTVIEGAVYETASGNYNTEYWASAVRVIGDNNVISNSYISNCAVPVRVAADLNIINTTLYGGTLGNLDLRGGHLVLTDVTTYNQADDRPIVGLGVVVNSSAVEGTSITINGTLNQYNYISSEDEDKINDSHGQTLYNKIFTGDTYDKYKFAQDGVKYVNTGIVSMSGYIGATEIVDNRSDKQDYSGQTVSMMGVSGYLYSVNNTGTMDRAYNPTSRAQGDYLPTFGFDLGAQEISYDGENDTRYCYRDSDGTIHALYKQGEDPISLDLTRLATVSKYTGQYYNLNAVCKNSSGTALSATNGVVTLSEAGSYTLEFTVDDNLFYDQNGERMEKSVSRTYMVPVVVSVAKANIQNAKITVTDSDGISVKGGNFMDPDYSYRINISDSVTITDYEGENDSGARVSWDSYTDCSFEGTISGGTATFSDGNGHTLVVTVGALTGVSFNPTTVTAGNDNGTLYIVTNGMSDNMTACTWKITSVTFTGNSGTPVTNSDGATVTWTVEEDSGGGGSCLAEGTLITLEDGSKRAVEDLRKDDRVMAFDHLTGEMTASDVIIVVRTRDDILYKNTFVFDDGTRLATINEHGIYDLNLRKYVNIDHENADEFIGHSFVSVDAKGNMGIKKLIDVICEVESGYKYDIVTNQTLNYVAEDTLSVTHVLVDIINSFEFADDMTFDQKKMAADIATYGLYTYDEWDEYCDYSVFEEYNIPVMKVGVSKGLYTKDYIIELINTYVLDESVQIIG